MASTIPSPTDVTPAEGVLFEHHRVAVDGGQVHWRSCGDGPPLVLLHGGHGDWGHWAANVAALSRRHRLWIPDMPGYGDTSVDIPDFATLVDTLRRALDALLGEDTRIDLAGFSFGGLTATLLAATRGGVRRLALLGPAGHGAGGRPRARMQNWRQDDPVAAEAALHANLMALMLHDPVRADARARSHYRRAVTRARFRSKTVSRTDTLMAPLAALTLPMLVVWGEHDVTADPSAIGPRLADGPDRRLVIVPDVGHWVQYEAAPVVDALLLDWFRP